MGGGPVAVRGLYRTRFGIESSSRQLGETRPRTACRDGVVRLLWVALGLIVRNAWVWANRGEARPWSFASARLILLLDILVTFTRQDPQLETTEYHLAADSERLLVYTRGRWGIENGLHSTRDMTSGEDRCRVRRGWTPRVLASLRNVAVYLLRGADYPSVATATRAMVARPELALA